MSCRRKRRGSTGGRGRENRTEIGEGCLLARWRRRWGGLFGVSGRDEGADRRATEVARGIVWLTRGSGGAFGGDLRVYAQLQKFITNGRGVGSDEAQRDGGNDDREADQEA
jgi:hypothetical protein